MFAPSQLDAVGTVPQSRDIEAAAREIVASIVAGCKREVPDTVQDLMRVSFMSGALWYQGVSLDELVRAAKPEGHA